MFANFANYVWTRTPERGGREEREKWRPIVGTKALGLVTIPKAWTPDYLVLGTPLYRAWKSAAPPNGASIIAEAVRNLQSTLLKAIPATDHGLVIRSSAVRESMSQRGAYQSLELPADFNDHSLAEAIDKIFQSFLELNTGDELALIVQARVPLSVRGHMSNERRVSKTENHWMWEVELSEYDAGRFNSQRSSAPETKSPLLCGNNGRSRLNSFRRIGRWCTQLKEGRLHLEWGYGGGRLWLFQLDFEEEQPDEGVDPNALLRDSDNLPASQLPQGSPIHVADFHGATGWSKIDKVRAFLNVRPAPYPILFYLTGAEFQAAKSAGRALVADIQSAVGERLVCRTDCTAAGIDRLNLPRTDSISAASAVAFMEGTLNRLTAQGAAPEETCFIFHKFIPAVVAAWALARPDRQIVLVDSLWGLPDGLQYLPHDTFEFDVRRNAISAEYIRFKPKFLQETPSGEWKLINVARNIARHRSLSTGDLREVANQTHAVATQSNKPIQIMWFCAVPESAGIGRNVPWFMMDPEPASGAPHTPIAPDKRRLAITSVADLGSARLQQSGKFILALDPSSELFRSSEFLNEVAATSLEKNFPVAMTGSHLAHAYYTLERKGVSVVSDISTRTRVRQRQVFRKLVRDEIPNKIAQHGEQANLAHIAKSESRTALVIKLFEEAEELLTAANPKDVATELADLLEVVRALSTATGVDWDQVQEAAEEKRKARGSFERNVVLMETSWPRWSEAAQDNTKMIPLKDLAEVAATGGEFLVNFAAAIAKDANNVIDLGNGTRLSVSIDGSGVRIVRLSDSEKAADHAQLEFGWE